MIYFLTDQALEDDTESDDNDADAPQDSDEAQDRGATQDKDEAQDAPGVATERQRDPYLPLISQKRKRQCTKVTAKKQNKVEKLEATLEKTMESFLKYQREVEEKFEEWEEKRR